MSRLIYESEVLGFTRNENIPYAQLKDVDAIAQFEVERIATKEYADQMIAARETYSNLPLYDAAASYVTGEQVVYDFKPYVAVADVLAGEDPDRSPKWENAPSFSGDFQQTFTDFLGPIMSNAIVRHSIVSLHTMTTNAGVIKNTRSAEEQDLLRVLRNIDASLLLYLNKAFRYSRDNNLREWNVYDLSLDLCAERKIQLIAPGMPRIK